jgi:uncharacterized protein
MIIETIFSTLNPEGVPNLSPMGVEWGDGEMIVRPFRNTHTYRYLIDRGYGVANITDDVMLFVQSALTDPDLPCFPAHHVPGVVLTAACFWRELAVTDETGQGSERAEIRCRVVGQGWQRDFLGFNRGRNAVIEALIMATRLHLYPVPQVWAELERSQEIVRKTGGSREQEAMDYVLAWVRRQIS